MALQQIQIPGDLTGCFAPDLSWAAPLPQGITSTSPGAGVQWGIRMLGSSVAQLRATPAIPSQEKVIFLQSPPFPQAIDLEEKPSFLNYETTHAVGTFLHELPTMHFAFNPEIFPVPKAPTHPHWVAEWTPLLCLGVVAMPGDRISHAGVAGLHHYLFSREHQGTTTVRIRAWIDLLQPGCVFCKSLKAAWPCPNSLLYLFWPFHRLSTGCPHGPGVQPVDAPVPCCSGFSRPPKREQGEIPALPCQGLCWV